MIKSIVVSTLKQQTPNWMHIVECKDCYIHWIVFANTCIKHYDRSFSFQQIILRKPQEFSLDHAWPI